MKLKSMLAVVFASTVLVGCAGLKYDSNYYTDVEPTPESISQTDAQRQIYKKTLYLPTDFKADGTLRTISEYDFSQETAPCTVISAYKERPVYRQEFFNVTAEKDGEKMEFLFECRSRHSVGNQHEHRLFMVGSYEECSKRSWDYRGSVVPLYQDLGKQCANGFETKTNKIVKENWTKFVMKKS